MREKALLRRHCAEFLNRTALRLRRLSRRIWRSIRISLTRDLKWGRAQVVQAEAAGVKPSVLMNPILLKPTNDKGSQIIVNGEVRGDMNAVDYFKYKKKLVPDIILDRIKTG